MYEISSNIQLKASLPNYINVFINCSCFFFGTFSRSVSYFAISINSMYLLNRCLFSKDVIETKYKETCKTQNRIVWFEYFETKVIKLWLLYFNLLQVINKHIAAIICFLYSVKFYFWLLDATLIGSYNLLHRYILRYMCSYIYIY
jgi:hypothetical protein